jgi:hypothetical protein
MQSSAAAADSPTMVAKPGIAAHAHTRTVSTSEKVIAGFGGFRP